MLRRAYVVVSHLQKYAGHRDELGAQIARLRAIEFDGLKRYKVVGCNAKTRGERLENRAETASMALRPRTVYNEVRKKMRIPHPAVFRKRGSDVSEWSSVTPGVAGRSELFGLGLWCDTVPVRERSPATRSPSGRATFRLILPEAIAIGVRFSHASRTGLDPWRIAP